MGLFDYSRFFRAQGEWTSTGSDISRTEAARRETFRARIQGIDEIKGKILALALTGTAVYGVIKLLDLVTD